MIEKLESKIFILMMTSLSIIVIGIKEKICIAGIVFIMNMALILEKPIVLLMKMTRDAVPIARTIIQKKSMNLIVRTETMSWIKTLIQVCFNK